ncbi:hypothetical protein CA11_07430 [Gimesia maris]|uniref:hypothetical protein n=1 Tax=Gimesia maris TaxID=122 RepID=UPI00118BACDC|nr:hypothetical protein [Gimesia maris]QDU12962.1 hypothetical protein CA11_07430 [Gimesia maris]
MNQNQCLAFLARHHPIRVALPQLLNVFGPGNGYGVYQAIEGAVMQYQAGNVVPQLLENLGSPAREIIYWNVQLAANFSTERLIASLTILVRSANEDFLAASLIAVRQIKSPRVPALLEALSCFPLTDEIRASVANHIDKQRQDQIP